MRKDAWTRVVESLFFFTCWWKNVCFVKLKLYTDNFPSLATDQKYFVCVSMCVCVGVCALACTGVFHFDSPFRVHSESESVEATF